MIRVDGTTTDKIGVLKDKTWQPYRQVFIVYAQKMNDDFQVITDQGYVLNGKKGDYLVWGPLGNKWPISRESFERNYECV